NSDGTLSIAELTAVTIISIPSLGVSDLTGIKHFANLERLNCNYNQITSLDVSGLAKLISLNCTGNKLTSLNVGGCVALLDLFCNNNELTNLELSGLSNLLQFICSQNRLTSLDLSGCTELVTLSGGYNRLKSLKLTGLGELKTLRCNDSELVSLDLKGLDKLEELYCYHNQLTGLSNLPASLIKMECYVNRLSSLPKLSDSLIFLNCGNNRLTSLPKLPASLETLNCYSNQLKSLDLSGYASLEELFCGANSLTSLNLTGCSALRALDCSGNLLINLNIAGCAALEGVGCALNQLSRLNAGDLSALTYLDCSRNQLTYLNLDGCTSLYDLECYENLLGTLDLSGCAALYRVSCYSNLLTSFAVSGLTSLYRLCGDENLLTELDLTGCTGLRELECGENLLETLILDGCVSLEGLDCWNNRLTSLDLSGCGELNYLGCNANLLTSLDLSGCVKLDRLYCYDNPLAGLDLSGLNALTYINCRNEVESFAFTDAAGNTLSVQTSGVGLLRFNYSLSDGSVRLSGIPGDGYRFARWTGDFIGSETEYSAEVTMSGPKTVTAVFAPLEANGISLSPSRAVLTEEGDSAVFTLTLSPVTADRAPIKWEVTANTAVTLSDLTGTDTLTITANSLFTSAEPDELLVRAVYEGEDTFFAATAKLQLLPGGIDYGAMQLTLLENKATINTAKTEGALIPALISELPNSSTAALGAASAMASAGSEIDADIQLLIKDKAGTLVPAAGLSAHWYEKDARYIEVKADRGTKSLKDVIVRLIPKSSTDPDKYIEAKAKLNLTITESYPKITIMASGSLNLFFPGEGVTLSAASPEGDCEIISIGGVSAKDMANVYYSGSLGKVMLMAKAAKGNYKLSVPVKVDGYDVSFAPGKVPTVTVKVVNAAPKLKLGAKSVVLTEYSNRNAEIGIFSADKGVSTADVLGKIAKVHFESATARGISFYYGRGDGAFLMKTKAYDVKSGGKGHIVVTFVGGAAAVKLPFTVSVLPEGKQAPSSKIKAMTVNIDKATGASLDVPVSINAASLYARDWEIVSVGSGKSAKPFAAPHALFGALSASDIHDSDGNAIGVRLQVESAPLLDAWFREGNPKANDKKIDLNLGSLDLP
ncbi:MAG: hypothetical protein FWE66_04355, partial [Oscillospiraceae bacterium]|nr:hypothetical protein [Oscillospiraceae bacterium]